MRVYQKSQDTLAGVIILPNRLRGGRVELNNSIGKQSEITALLRYTGPNYGSRMQKPREFLRQASMDDKRRSRPPAIQTHRDLLTLFCC